MSRIYFDSMLFIYWLEGVEPLCGQVGALIGRIATRGDRICTSVFTLGEVLVGPEKRGDDQLYSATESLLTGPDVELIPFTRDVAVRFASIRGKHKVKPPDTIHLASAASANVDLFLTNDQAVRRLTIDGIRFIDGLETTVLGID